VRRGLLVLALLVGLTGCMDDAARDTEDGDEHRAGLEADRTRAGDLVRALAPRFAADLAGTVRTASGSFRGCRGRSPEGVAAVEYVASARIDAGRAAPDDLLAPVPAYLRGLGDDPVTSPVPGGRRISIETEGSTVTVTTRSSAGPFLLLAVTGACRDIPADEQDEWLGLGVDDLT
jgi:hypothetical protein